MVLKFRVCLIVFWQDSLYLALIVLVLVDGLGPGAVAAVSGE